MNLLRSLLRLKPVKLAEFKFAGQREFDSTAWSRRVTMHDPIFWTPLFQKRSPSARLEDFLLDESFYPHSNIFSPHAREQSINRLVEAFLDDAFDLEELAREQPGGVDSEGEPSKNLKLKPTSRSSLHGNIDFLIYNEQTKKFLAILVHPQGLEYTNDNGYFDISEYAARCVQWYFIRNYQMEQGFQVMTTNGHKWQLHRRNKSGTYEKSKVLHSVDQLIYRDPEVIAGVLGFIRFACDLKCESQEIIEGLYDLYNDQAVLQTAMNDESNPN